MSTAVLTGPSSSLLLVNLLAEHPKATIQHRLAGYALDVALLLSTCFIGWFIWSLVIWNQGLTPAKQILKMQVVSSHSGRPATWGHMAIRQFLIPMTLNLPFSIIAAAIDPTFYGYSYDPALEVLSFMVSMLGLAVVAFDAFWIFYKGQNRRVTDFWAKTDVINTAVKLPQPASPYVQPQL